MTPKEIRRKTRITTKDVISIIEQYDYEVNAWFHLWLFNLPDKTKEKLNMKQLQTFGKVLGVTIPDGLFDDHLTYPIEQLRKMYNGPKR